MNNRDSMSRALVLTVSVGMMTMAIRFTDWEWAAILLTVFVIVGTYHLAYMALEIAKGQERAINASAENLARAEKAEAEVAALRTAVEKELMARLQITWRRQQMAGRLARLLLTRTGCTDWTRGDFDGSGRTPTPQDLQDCLTKWLIEGHWVDGAADTELIDKWVNDLVAVVSDPWPAQIRDYLKGLVPTLRRLQMDLDGTRGQETGTINHTCREVRVHLLHIMLRIGVDKLGLPPSEIRELIANLPVDGLRDVLRDLADPAHWSEQYRLVLLEAIADTAAEQ